ncbi:MAG: hypothetical protein H5T84_06700 [Thermoleophilia bacterium]|nr:hypothetical protein [Thermoleophilia bacterium]
MSAAMRLIIRHGAGSLTVQGGASPGLLYEGFFGGGVAKEVSWGEGPSAGGDELPGGGKPTVVLRDLAPDRPRWPLPWRWRRDRQALAWEVRLTEEMPLELVVETGAVESFLDLSTLLLEDFYLNTAASDTELILPARGDLVRARIGAGAAAVRVIVPEGVEARIRGGLGLGSLHVDSARFPRREDGSYQSPGFEERGQRNGDGKVGRRTAVSEIDPGRPDTAPSGRTRIDLLVEGGVGVVSIR